MFSKMRHFAWVEFFLNLNDYFILTKLTKLKDSSKDVRWCLHYPSSCELHRKSNLTKSKFHFRTALKSWAATMRSGPPILVTSWTGFVSWTKKTDSNEEGSLTSQTPGAFSQPSTATTRKFKLFKIPWSSGTQPFDTGVPPNEKK
jgi:hypothetical protein